MGTVIYNLPEGLQEIPVSFQPPTTGDGYCNSLFSGSYSQTFLLFQPPTTGDGYCNKGRRKKGMVEKIKKFQPPTTGDGYCNSVRGALLWKAISFNPLQPGMGTVIY